MRQSHVSGSLVSSEPLPLLGQIEKRCERPHSRKRVMVHEVEDQNFWNYLEVLTLEGLKEAIKHLDGLN